LQGAKRWSGVINGCDEFVSTTKCMVHASTLHAAFFILDVVKQTCLKLLPSPGVWATFILITKTIIRHYQHVK